MCALPDQVTFELGERAENMEDKLATRGRGVDLLGEGAEADATLRQRGDDVDQVLQGATQTIEPPDHQCVPPS
jgi:hypothetical protein